MRRGIGLFFGSFNPIHIGHLIIANLVWTEALVDEVWFVVSPQNPHKKRVNLLPERDRLDLVRECIKDEYHLRVSDIEFGMPRPNYTIHTLAYLEEKYPHFDFRLIIGEDNLNSLPRWKNFKEILKRGLIVYPRPNCEVSELSDHQNICWVDAPKMDISATLIRRLIREGKSIKYLVPDEVVELIEGRKYYN
ncbi:MAG: nicotinate (nicotinamide) nucleotide adenylyltransferase [Cyclobacteriaceae bacterium]|jgi:nicotinate-nucleotide adenylyltransferase